jgi:DNA-binding PadR family transcriptional regulator
MNNKIQTENPFRSKIDIISFFIKKAAKGIPEIRARELKKIAKINHMSSDTLYQHLKFFEKTGFLIPIKRTVEGRQAVFYALSNKYRDEYLRAIRKMDKDLETIFSMSNEEKIEAIDTLLRETSIRFAAVVPEIVGHFLLNRDKLENLTEELETWWWWILYPFLFQTVKTSLLNSDVTEKLPLIQERQESYKEFLNSEYFRKIKRLHKAYR